MVYQIVSEDMLAIETSSLVILIWLGFGCAQKEDQSTLRFVTAAWRHGDRSPARTFPTDTRNIESSWPQGFGELSKIGIQQQYALGGWLRQRYNGFISDKYSKYEVYYRSTDYNRTLMSAQANAAGMFPPKGAQVWNKDIQWQPIPIHTIPRDQDYKLWNEIPCPTADSIFHKHFASPEMAAIDQENADFFKFMAEKSGLGDQLKGLADIWYLSDPLFVEWMHNNDSTVPRLPDWFNVTLRHTLFNLSNIAFRNYFPQEMIKFHGGPLLFEIIDGMEQRALHPEQRLKYFVYSGHDTVIGALLASVGAYTKDMPQPPYASLLLFELHEINKQWIVKVLYRNSTSEPPHLLSISDCPNPCKLSDLRARSEWFYLSDWKYECGLVSFALLIVLCIACLLVLLLLITLFVIVSRGKTHVYTTVQQDEGHLLGRGATSPVID